MTWINEQKIESPFEQWPGYMTIPAEITDEQFCIWYENVKEEDDDEGEHELIKAYGRMKHLILEWNIRDPDGDVVDFDKVHSMKLHSWVVMTLTELLEDSQSFPKSPVQSNGTLPPGANTKTSSAKRTRKPRPAKTR